MSEDEPERPAGKGWLILVVGALVLVVGAIAWILVSRPDDKAPMPGVVHAPPAVPTPADKPAPDIRSLAAPDQLTRAFQAAFGRPDSASRRITGEEFLQDDMLVYRPAALEWIGDRAALVSLGTNESDCHACTGAIAVHYLKPRDMAFAVEKQWLTAMVGSGWGQPTNKMIVNRDLSSFPVVMSEIGFTGQGCTSGGVLLTELRPEGPVAWDYVPTQFDDSGTIGAEQRGRAATIEGVIVDIRRDQGFAVTYKGARSFRETYARRGSKMERVGGKSNLPSC